MNTTTTQPVAAYYVIRAGGCGHLVRLLKQPLPATGLAEMQATGLCASCYRDADTGQLVLADQPIPAGVMRWTARITLAEFRADQAALAVEATQPEHAAIEPGYVVAEDGAVYVQRPADNQWGFELLSDDQSWPGGFGIGTWERVTADDPRITDDDRERLGWLFDEP